MSKKNGKKFDCMPADVKESLTILPDSFSIGTSTIKDIIILEFSTSIDGNTYTIKRFALTAARAKSIVKGLNTAIESCETKAVTAPVSNSQEKK